MIDAHLLRKFLVSYLVIELGPLLLSDVSVSSGSTKLLIFIPPKLPLLEQRR